MRSQVPLWATSDDMISALKNGTDSYGRDKKPIDIILNQIIKIEQFKDSDYKEEIINRTKNIQFNIDNLTKESSEITRSIDKQIQRYDDLLKDKRITDKQYKNKIESLEATEQKRMANIIDKLAKEQEKMNKLNKGINNSNPSTSKKLPSNL